MDERESSESAAPDEQGARTGKAQLHLVVGPVAAGKSTFALRLAREQGAVLMNLDEWMAQLFHDEARPESGIMAWYVERTARCIEQIWRMTERLVAVGTSVVLEIGLIQRADRERLYERVEASGFALTIYVLDGSRELRRERVKQRNREQGETFSMVVPAHIFELASDLWEPLDATECSGRDVRFIEGDR